MMGVGKTESDEEQTLKVSVYYKVTVLFHKKKINVYVFL